MTQDSFAQALEKLIPKSLDDVIRKNREKFRLALATEDELVKLEANVPDSPVRYTLTDWQVIMLHATLEDRAKIASPRLAGRVEATGESWITSNVVGIDRGKGLVQTANSMYRVIGPRVEEDKIDLLNICVALHQWGLGSSFGVPEFFY
ncbi:hypothetical protein [Sulfuriferula sp.]|uniref:hypothetical protein n=1 Tax=Sulfuriferula sp. TaxID=2025307 RepID=UPI002730C4B4|nr:hypothetical protein [Sulfuriferula sp.]MDP2024752.1 hypothetical protein [Sulfuriferula sp.]